MENNDFVRLEQFVETLIGKFKEQKDKLQALEQKLRDREEECEILKLDIAELQEQRAEVGRRVVGLLGRIEHWGAETEEKEEQATD